VLPVRWRSLGLVLLAGCAARAGGRAPATAEGARRPAFPAIVSSNILRGDYAGSRACAGCHSDIYDKFMAAPMHNMTRLPAGDTVQAPFAGERFRFKDDAVELETRGSERFMTIVSPTQGTRTFKITKVIGGHYREDFAGVEVGTSDTGNERILPATYFLVTKTWRYKGYSVMGPERPGLRPGGIWNKTCIFCHNTIPYFSDIQGAIADARIGPYQGEVVDPLLPAERRARYRMSDEPAFVRAVNDELARLGARATTATTATAAAADLVRATRARFNAASLIELGIGCESCHGGSLEHVKHNATKPSFTPHSAFMSIDSATPDAKDAAARRAIEMTRVCARCHQVLFTQYQWTWEGGLRKGTGLPGGSNINSGEARDFLLGGCASAMTCSDCHDPHGHNRARADEIEARADAVCLRCHAQLATVEAQRAHTHHDPAGAGGRCLNCHMPRKNMTLDNRLGRYHRVASPTETAKVEGDRPLECALCHGDRPVAELVATMEAWWHKRYDRNRLRALYGDDLAHADVLVETLARGKPHEQAVALALLGARGPEGKRVAPLVAAELTHEVPILRYYAANALAALLGEAPPLDVHAHNNEISAAAAVWLRQHGLAPATRAPSAAKTGTGGDNEDQ
jgi:predicted CXXCH cytochrome family protein